MLRYILSLFIGGIFLSCGISKKIGVIQIEIMQPAQFASPANLKSVELINCDFKTRNGCPVMKALGGDLVIDTIRNRELSSICIEAISKYLKENSSFQDINCTCDSSAQLIKIEKMSPSVFFENRTSDLCIFLDSLKFQRIFNDSIQEFDQIKATFSWLAKYKTDSLVSSFFKSDSLIFTDVDNSFYLSDKYFYPYRDIIRYCNEIGKYIGNQVIPTWQLEERMYYKSGNPEMIKAEKFAKDNDWLKAAETWNKMARNKNSAIAAKASYNMALSCEIEGQLDAAVDWLIQSHSLVKKSNKEHQDNCQRYINLLATRKKEIEKLAKQVRNN